MPTPTKSSQVIAKMETLALNLLGKANEDDALLDTKLDVFEKMTKWVAVKNKLEDDGAGGIADYKRRLQGAPDKHPPRRSRGETGGDRLAAIKSRLPVADDGGIDGDSGGAGGEIPAVA